MRWFCGVFLLPGGGRSGEVAICRVVLGGVDAGVVLVHLDGFGEGCHQFLQHCMELSLGGCTSWSSVPIIIRREG